MVSERGWLVVLIVDGYAEGDLDTPSIPLFLRNTNYVRRRDEYQISAGEANWACNDSTIFFFLKIFVEATKSWGGIELLTFGYNNSMTFS